MIRRWDVVVVLSCWVGVGGFPWVGLFQWRECFFCQKSAWWWVSTCLAACWRLVTDHELDHWIILFLPRQADLFSVGCILWHGEKEMRRARPLAFVRTASLFMSHKVNKNKVQMTYCLYQTMYYVSTQDRCWVSSPNALLSNLSIFEALASHRACAQSQRGLEFP